MIPFCPLQLLFLCGINYWLGSVCQSWAFWSSITLFYLLCFINPLPAANIRCEPWFAAQGLPPRSSGVFPCIPHTCSEQSKPTHVFSPHCELYEDVICSHLTLPHLPFSTPVPPHLPSLRPQLRLLSLLLSFLAPIQLLCLIPPLLSLSRPWFPRRIRFPLKPRVPRRRWT